MILRPRRSTLTHTLFPYTPLFRAPDPDLLDAPRAQRRLQGRARRRDSPHRLAPPGRGRLEAGDGPELPPRRSRRRPCADAGGRACRKDRADGGMTGWGPFLSASPRIKSGMTEKEWFTFSRSEEHTSEERRVGKEGLRKCRYGCQS